MQKYYLAGEKTKYYLAVDIGASSGRHILGCIEDGKLILEEAYRFDNGYHEQDGRLVWDAQALFQEIVAGMRQCAKLGKIPVSMGIDTWGVDYVLLDDNDRELWPAYSYRDRRGTESQAAVEAIVPYPALYAATGIPRQPFNTIYQLWHDKQAERLGQASRMLMLPEYFHWRLTGKVRHEYTIASTTGLMNAKAADWDWEMIDALCYPRRLFGEINLPGSTVGQLQNNIRQAVGFDCMVILPGMHDTASAVAACPCAGDAPLYISSGTWSLMGTELESPLCTEAARLAGFTNEGGANGKIRFLKNIMGLWMLQQIKREQPQKLSYDDMMHMAQASIYDGELNVQNQAFNTPASMIQAVRATLNIPGLPLPDVIRAVYHGLARCYAQTAREIEEITGRQYGQINIIGGGSGDRYLNELTARYSGKPVAAGPKEATAIGNLLAQLVAGGAIASMEEGRTLVRESICR